MKIEFEKEYLRELFEDGITSNKKFRFQPQVVKQYRKVVDRLSYVQRIEDLYAINSVNYEKLSGNKQGLESVRVNDQYRIEFRSSRIEESPKTITVCSLIELSKHYK